jgi:hypothetical protein
MEGKEEDTGKERWDSPVQEVGDADVNAHVEGLVLEHAHARQDAKGT